MKRGKGRAVSVARRMAGKKGAAIQLQQEVNTDEEWDEMVKKPGLIVVDIYSGWCGPCVGMVGNLKKVKLEIGGDLLHLAINGKMVNLMFGANAPRLIKLMTDEIKKEGDFQKGLIDRPGIGFMDLTPEEQERAEVKRKKDEEKRLAREEEMNAELEKRRQKVIKRLVKELKYDSVVLFLPFLYDKENNSWPAYDKLMDSLGVVYSTKKESLINLKMQDAEKLFGTYDEDLSEELAKQLKQGQCLVKIIGIPAPRSDSIKPEEELEGQGDEPALEPQEPPLDDAEEGEEHQAEQVNIVETVHYAIYGSHPPQPGEEEDILAFEDEEEEGEDRKSLNLLAQTYQQFAEVTSVPALWAPATDEQKAAAVMLLLPEYVEELLGPEPPPLPPHLAVIFDASKYPELMDTLKEYKDDVIHSGFFDSPDPNSAKKVAHSYNDYLLSKKTGNEKFVVMLNNSKSDPVLALAQLAPVYVSLNQEEGKEDCDKLFPDEEEQELDLEKPMEAESKASLIGEELTDEKMEELVPGFKKMSAPKQAMERALISSEKPPDSKTEVGKIVDDVLSKSVGATGEPAGPAQAAVEDIVAASTGEKPAGPAQEAVQDIVGTATGETQAKEAVSDIVDKTTGAKKGTPSENAASEAADAVAAAATGDASPEAKKAGADAAKAVAAKATGAKAPGAKGPGAKSVGAKAPGAKSVGAAGAKAPGGAAVGRKSGAAAGKKSTGAAEDAAKDAGEKSTGAAGADAAKDAAAKSTDAAATAVAEDATANVTDAAAEKAAEPDAAKPPDAAGADEAGAKAPDAAGKKSVSVKEGDAKAPEAGADAAKDAAAKAAEGADEKVAEGAEKPTDAAGKDAEAKADPAAAKEGAAGEEATAGEDAEKNPAEDKPKEGDNDDKKAGG